ncbi:MAG: DNA-3-methyladenine glycosylase 1 [Synergistetes bacterium ADurb.Bin155]|mgnify:FL=1|nr:MAG: DNA-3-methyladenine glycosylase 1 [Synergistetes bacterium ADurb.Bin155]
MRISKRKSRRRSTIADPGTYSSDKPGPRGADESCGPGVVPPLARCPWSESHPLLLGYHDSEWGMPVHDDGLQFEFLVLESFQAGLSWLTVLKKRERFREAFHGFDPARIASYGESDLERLLRDEGIIRNEKKIRAAVTNARAFLALAEKEGSFSNWLWGFVEGEPIVGGWDAPEQVPSETPLSRLVSGELKRRGFTFMGPVVVYSHMQAVGLVNDHLRRCFRYGRSSS